jgi:hypothetical protein
MADPNLKSLSKALTDLATHSKEQKEHLSNIADGVKPLSVAGGLVTKALEMLVGSVVGGMKTLADMRIQNADLLVDQKRMRDIIKDQGYSIGTLAQHSQMQLNLHRIGYKEINKDLREQLVWLEKQGGQGQDVLKFMSSMSEKGADLRTQTKIAQRIVDVARYTGQSARAAIGSAAQLGDMQTVMAAIGLQGPVLEALVTASEDMPAQQAIVLGQFAEELVNPKNIEQSILLGMHQGGKEFLRRDATVDERIDALFRTAEIAGVASENYLKSAREDPIILKFLREDLVGPGGLLSIQVKNAKKMKKAGANIGTGADSFKTSTDEYMGSFLRVAETLEDAGQVVASTFEDDLLGPKGLISDVFRIANQIGDMIPSWNTIADAFIWIAGHLGGAPLSRSESQVAQAYGLFTREGLDKQGGTGLELGTKEARNFQKAFAESIITEAIGEGRDVGKYASWKANIEKIYEWQHNKASNRYEFDRGMMGIDSILMNNRAEEMLTDLSDTNPLARLMGVAVAHGMKNYASQQDRLLNIMWGTMREKNKNLELWEKLERGDFSESSVR